MIRILDLITMVGIAIDKNEQQRVIVNDDGGRLTNDEALKHLRGKLESGQIYYESLNHKE